MSGSVLVMTWVIAFKEDTRIEMKQIRNDNNNNNTELQE